MIFGVGTDIAAVARIGRLYERHGERALEKLLAPAEHADFEKSKDPERFLAKRFAAKEALSKALGTGFSAQINFKNFSVSNLPSGQPVATLSGAALETMQKNGAKRVFLSISHDKGCAVAMAILEA